MKEQTITTRRTALKTRAKRYLPTPMFLPWSHCLNLPARVFGYDGPPSPERRIRAAKIADQAYRKNDLAPFRALQVILQPCASAMKSGFAQLPRKLRAYCPNNPAVLLDGAQRFILGTSDRSEGVALLERAHELLPVENSSYGVLSAFVELQNSLDKEAILEALNLRSEKLSPPLQPIEMVLRARMGDASGAERMRQSLQALGFTQRSAYLDLFERQCWTNRSKKSSEICSQTNWHSHDSPAAFGRRGEVPLQAASTPR
jgi:hypothetical protein